MGRDITPQVPEPRFVPGEPVLDVMAVQGCIIKEIKYGRGIDHEGNLTDHKNWWYKVHERDGWTHENALKKLSPDNKVPWASCPWQPEGVEDD